MFPYDNDPNVVSQAVGFAVMEAGWQPRARLALAHAVRGNNWQPVSQLLEL